MYSRHSRHHGCFGFLPIFLNVHSDDCATEALRQRLFADRLGLTCTHSDGLKGYDLRSHGLYSHGLYSYGINEQNLDKQDIAPGACRACHILAYSVCCCKHVPSEISVIGLSLVLAVEHRPHWVP